MPLSKIKTNSIADNAVTVKKQSTGTNILYNGEFKIHQRGGVKTSGSNYLLDRWYTYLDAHGLTYQAEQSTDVPSGQDFHHSYKVAATGGSYSTDNNYVMIRQNIETQDVRHLQYGTSTARKTTLSFWVKTPRTGNITANFMHYGGGTQRQCSIQFAVTAANTWQRMVGTLPADTSVAFGSADNDKAFYFDIIFNIANNWSDGTTLNTSWNNNVSGDRGVGQTNMIQANGEACYITGIQLEIGEVDDPVFHFRTDAEELERCQRYYIQYVPEGTYTTYGIGFVTGSTTAEIFFPFPTTMRGEPGLNNSTPLGDFRIYEAGTRTVTGMTVQNYSNNKMGLASVTCSGGGMTTGRACKLQDNGNKANNYIGWSAEIT